MAESAVGPNRAPEGFARTYGVELLFDRPPTLAAEKVLSIVQRQLPQTELIQAEGAAIQFAHRDHVVRFADGEACATTAVLMSEHGVDESDFREALDQTGDWPDASKTLARCGHRLLVTDLLSSTLPYQDRLDLIWVMVKAVAQATGPLVCHWQRSGKLVDPGRLGNDPLYAALNVRLFRVESGRDGECVMDTLGLAALGVRDVQCHFSGLEPGRVAAWLHSVGRYLYENGDVIGDGHTLQGLEPAHKWRCQHTRALVAPTREVVDVDPGEPFAVGR
jgi:hypothetical protein